MPTLLTNTHHNVHSFALKPCNEEAKALVIPRRVSHSQCCERLNREWARQCEKQLSKSPLAYPNAFGEALLASA